MLATGITRWTVYEGGTPVPRPALLNNEGWLNRGWRGEGRRVSREFSSDLGRKLSVLRGETVSLSIGDQKLDDGEIGDSTYERKH
jgi:hypothetical protein